MPEFATKRIVKHSAHNMFCLVSDLERYPEFVPYCVGLKIIKLYEVHHLPAIDAIMKIAYKGFSESFTSQVILNEDDLKIDVHYLSGPIKHLSNKWQFKIIDDTTCEVNFRLEYSFKNPLLSYVMNSVFQTVFGKFAQSFEERANAVYK